MSLSSQCNVNDCLSMSLTSQCNVNHYLSMSLSSQCNVNDYLSMSLSSQCNVNDYLSMSPSSQCHVNDYLSMSLSSQCWECCHMTLPPDIVFGNDQYRNYCRYNYKMAGWGEEGVILYITYSVWCLLCFILLWLGINIDGLVQERCKSGVLAIELRLSCTNPLRCDYLVPRM